MPRLKCIDPTGYRGMAGLWATDEEKDVTEDQAKYLTTEQSKSFETVPPPAEQPVEKAPPGPPRTKVPTEKHK